MTTTLSVSWTLHVPDVPTWCCLLIRTVPLHDVGEDDMPGLPYASQLPEAFKPEMLATLEKSCRKFFMCVAFFSWPPPVPTHPVQA
jgi:hypothetical protein